MPQSAHSGYQLRRIGEAATKTDVPDIMTLKQQDMTTFGRRQEMVDYYVDSSRLKNMISRLHAEIHSKYNSSQEDYVYFITDKSLNGTYVNDTRVSNSVQLKEGDVIIFGHINGVSIKPGEFSKQKKSEFKFMFEKCGGDDDSSAGGRRSTSGGKKKKSNLVLQDMSSTFNTSTFSSDDDMDVTSGPPDGRAGGRTSSSSKGKQGGRGGKAGGRGGAGGKRGKGGRKSSGGGGGGDAQYEYSQEACESDTCRRPTGSTVDWVQCDDCDKWYHTECVGLDLQELREEDTFHCGCS